MQNWRTMNDDYTLKDRNVLDHSHMVDPPHCGIVSIPLGSRPLDSAKVRQLVDRFDRIAVMEKEQEGLHSS